MVAAEWRRAWRALRAAEVLAQEGLYEDAVSRAYYATLHAAKAALFIHDVATESHAAVRRMFGLHLIRSGEIESMWSSNLGESFDDRLAADYDASAPEYSSTAYTVTCLQKVLLTTNSERKPDDSDSGRLVQTL
jgi:uncharacterized protein (UPF0332 family)